MQNEALWALGSIRSAMLWVLADWAGKDQVSGVQTLVKDRTFPKWAMAGNSLRCLTSRKGTLCAPTTVKNANLPQFYTVDCDTTAIAIPRCASGSRAQDGRQRTGRYGAAVEAGLLVTGVSGRRADDC